MSRDIAIANSHAHCDDDFPSLSDADDTASPDDSLFVSNRPDEFTDHVRANLAPHHVKYADPSKFNATSRIVKVDEIALVDISYAVNAKISPAPVDDLILVHSVIGGAGVIRNGEREFELSPSVIHVSAPGDKLDFLKTAGSRYLTVKTTRGMLKECMSDLASYPIRGDVEFMEMGMEDARLARAWNEQVIHLMRQASLLCDRHFAARHFRILLEMLLMNVPHNFSEFLHNHDGGALPAHIGKTVEIINGNLSDSISLIDLAQATGVSVRSIQAGFTKSFGTSPAAYIRSARLKRLHERLKRAEPGDTVTDLMLIFGISNFGRYAHYYKEIYGCPPSATLRKFSDSGVLIN